MLPDEQAIKLHHRSVLGETLTAEDQNALETWYAKQDAEEMQAINLEVDETELNELRAQFKMSVAQLAVEAQRLQQLEEENEALRQEVALLQQRLTRKQMLEAA